MGCHPHYWRKQSWRDRCCLLGCHALLRTRWLCQDHKRDYHNNKEDNKGNPERTGHSNCRCPDVSVVAFDSKDFNIYGLSDGMKERGWALNALQFPSCVHLCVTRPHTLAGVADKFIKDVTEITAEIMKDPSGSNAGSAAMYGMAASIPDRSIVEDLTGVYLDSLYCLGPTAAIETKIGSKDEKRI